MWKSNFVMPAHKKSPARRGFFFDREPFLTDLRYVGCLRSFLSLHDVELHFVPFGERLEAGSTDGAEMDENVGASLSRNEAKSLGVIEPLYRTSYPCHLTIPLDSKRANDPASPEEGKLCATIRLRGP